MGKSVYKAVFYHILSPCIESIMPHKKNTTRVFSSFFGILVSFSILTPAVAQDCRVYYEMVTALHSPKPGAFTVWQSEYGVRHEEEVFVSGVALDKGVLALGERSQGKDTPPEQLVLSYFSEHGRLKWSRKYRVEGLHSAVKILQKKDGYLVLANVQKPKALNSLWIGFFDYNGGLVSKKTIKDGRFNLKATNIIEDADGEGWLVSVSASRTFGTGLQESEIKNATIYRLDKNGNETDSRAYILGQKNEILGLSVLKLPNDMRGIIATGYFESDGGKHNGWLLGLGDDLSLVWQKELRRGYLAKLKYIVQPHEKYVYAFGDVKSSNSGFMGAWFAAFDPVQGELFWQRYFHAEHGAYDYEARGLFVNKDGVSSVLMAAHPREDVLDAVKNKVELDGHGDYFARILMLNPRGTIISGDSYFYGDNSYPHALLETQSGSPVVVGHTDVTALTIQDRKLSGEEDAGFKGEPLTEYGSVNLPDAKISKKAQKGLKILKDKMGAQEYINHNDEQKMANDSPEIDPYTRNGWVLVGDRVDTYTDPCKKRN